MEEKIYKALSNIIDPEVGFDIVSLGLIYGVEFKDQIAKITMTLSTKTCPLHDMILDWVKTATLSVDGVKGCEVNLVWEPVWSIQMASDSVKVKLGV